jgi:broad specificity phosphatase PhoE
MHKLLLILLLLLAAPASLAAQAQPTTVILIRHAEKAATPADNPPLSAAGLARVQRLVEIVRHAGLTAIYSTPYTRTLDTARGVAKALDLQITETPIPNRNVPAYGDSVAARVRRDGGVILVVSHSNTMGAVVKALGGPDIGEVADAEYDHIFILNVQNGKPARLLKTSF